MTSEGNEPNLSAEEESSSEAIQWVTHPARKRPLTALLVAVLLIGLWTALQISVKDPWMTVLAVVVLSISVAPFYLPTRYGITEDGITIRSVFGTREKPWDLYRRCQADRYGVLLSPFDHPSRLDRFHGLNLRFDEEDRDRVVAYIRRRLPSREQTGTA